MWRTPLARSVLRLNAHDDHLLVLTADRFVMVGKVGCRHIWLTTALTRFRVLTIYAIYHTPAGMYRIKWHARKSLSEETWHFPFSRHGSEGGAHGWARSTYTVWASCYAPVACPRCFHPVRLVRVWPCRISHMLLRSQGAPQRRRSCCSTRAATCTY